MIDVIHTYEIEKTYFSALEIDNLTTIIFGS